MTWASGDTLDSLTLNLRGASASTSAGFSSNTLRAESGNTVSTGTYAIDSSFDLSTNTLLPDSGNTISFGSSVASAITFFGALLGPVSTNTVQAQSGNTVSFVGSIASATTHWGVPSSNTFAIQSGLTANFSASTISVTDIAVAAGSAVNPSFAFVSEQSLGWYKSAASTLALSYGTLQLPSNITFRGVELGPAGTALAPTWAYQSEASLGWYRSGTSVMALSYGGVSIKAGTNASCGTAVLSVGSIKVNTTFVQTGDLIFLTDQSPGGTLGDLEINGITSGVSFGILSTSVTDTSTVAWLIVRPS